jgi:hypothetical protein
MTVHMNSQRLVVQIVLEDIPFFRPVWKTAFLGLQCFICTDLYEMCLYGKFLTVLNCRALTLP